MKYTRFVLKGDIAYSLDRTTIRTVPNGYLVCIDGHSAGVFDALPETYQNLPVLDYTGKLILPGLVDLHVHAPQYTYRALGMDMELLEWLETNTFPEERRYAALDYAAKAYGKFVDDLVHSPNTRACIFATCHTDATLLLMDLLDKSGLVSMVGRVNMDRNCSDIIREESASYSLNETRRWVEGAQFANTTPILTPRFVPTCSDEVLKGLGALQKETGLPVQSHLSENFGEIAWVKELCPWSEFYGDVYDRFGLFGGEGCPTIMAHCVHSTEEEVERMAQKGVFIAHCPQSNTNIASGIAPVRRYLDRGIPMGLGSDVAGGAILSIFRAMADAIQVSKLRWRLVDQSLKPLTAAEAFWMGTVGGGAFFGKVGSFAEGYELDAIVVDDSRLDAIRPFTLEQRVERAIYLSEDRDITGKFCRGKQLF